MRINGCPFEMVLMKNSKNISKERKEKLYFIHWFSWQYETNVLQHFIFHWLGLKIDYNWHVLELIKSNRKDKEICNLQYKFIKNLKMLLHLRVINSKLRYYIVLWQVLEKVGYFPSRLTRATWVYSSGPQPINYSLK